MNPFALVWLSRTEASLQHSVHDAGATKSGPVKWMETVGVHVQLDASNDATIRDTYQIDHELLLVTAHATAATTAPASGRGFPPITPGRGFRAFWLIHTLTSPDPPFPRKLLFRNLFRKETIYIGTDTYDGTGTSGQKLPASWCGMNSADLKGVIAYVSEDTDLVSDADRTSYNSGGDQAALITALETAMDSDGWGTMLDAALKGELATALFENVLKTDYTEALAAGEMKNVADPTGGFIHFLTNNMANSDGKYGGFEIRVCAITKVKEYESFHKDGYFPLYKTEAAAQANSVDSQSDTIALNQVAYYMPAVPSETTGNVRCGQGEYDPDGADEAAKLLNCDGTGLSRRRALLGLDMFGRKASPKQAPAKRSVLAVTTTVPYPDTATSTSMYLEPRNASPPPVSNSTPPSSPSQPSKVWEYHKVRVKTENTNMDVAVNVFILVLFVTAFFVFMFALFRMCGRNSQVSQNFTQSRLGYRRV